MSVIRCEGCDRFVDMDEDVENANPCDVCQDDKAYTGYDKFGFRCMDCNDTHQLEAHGIEIPT